MLDVHGDMSSLHVAVFWVVALCDSFVFSPENGGRMFIQTVVCSQKATNIVLT
jgi:hypothetical protein